MALPNPEHDFNFEDVRPYNLFTKIASFSATHDTCAQRPLVEEACREFNQRAFYLLIPFTGLDTRQQEDLNATIAACLLRQKTGLDRLADASRDAARVILVRCNDNLASSPSAKLALHIMVSGIADFRRTWYFLLHGAVASANAPSETRKQALGSIGPTFETATSAIFNQVLKERDILARHAQLLKPAAAKPAA